MFLYFLEAKLQNHFLFQISVCYEKASADIVWILDDSGSVGYTNFRQMLEFVKTFVRSFKIGPLNVQMGAITFSTHAHEYIKLKDKLNEQDLINAINRLPYQSGTTHTSEALMGALNSSFTPQLGDRDSVTDIMIVITDGQSQNPRATAAAADRVHKSGVKVFAIGIGNHVMKTELNAIASDKDHVFHVQNFDALHLLKEELQNKVCACKYYI